MSAVLEKARADYDAWFSSAFNDGIETGLIKVAKNMLEKGYDCETVAECTGLSLEFIKALQI